MQKKEKITAREIREEIGLSQGGLAAALGTGIGTVRKWDSGERNISATAFAALKLLMIAYRAGRLEKAIESMNKIEKRKAL